MTLIIEILVLLQWGHVFSDVETNNTAELSDRVCGASMGPRLFRRGNLVALLSWARSLWLLQWGHVFSDVETRTSRLTARRS